LFEGGAKIAHVVDEGDFIMSAVDKEANLCSLQSRDKAFSRAFDISPTGAMAAAANENSINLWHL